VRVDVLKPKVSAALRAAIDEIEGAGVTPSAEEIIWLHNLVEKRVLPTSGTPPAATRYPFKVGRVWFYPLTTAAYIWFTDRASVWWREDDAMLTDALAFAMAHSDGASNPFPQMMECRKTCALRVRAWAVVHLTFSRKTVVWAISQFYGSEKSVSVDATGIAKAKGEDDDTVFEWGELTAYVAAAYGLDPERIQRMGMNEVLGLAKRAPKPSGYKGAADDPDAIKANAHLRLAIRHIIRTHKEREAQADG